jgi:hypothetical protein
MPNSRSNPCFGLLTLLACAYSSLAACSDSDGAPGRSTTEALSGSTNLLTNPAFDTGSLSLDCACPR